MTEPSPEPKPKVQRIERTRHTEAAPAERQDERRGKHQGKTRASAIVVHQGLPLAKDRPPEYELRRLPGFLDPHTIDGALEAADWDVSREIRLYVEIANDPAVPPATRIKACEAIHRLVIRAMTASGELVKAQYRHETEDGSVVTVERMARVTREAQAALELAKDPEQPSRTERPEETAPDKETLDVEVEPEIEAEAETEAEEEHGREGAGAPSSGADGPARGGLAIPGRAHIDPLRPRTRTRNHAAEQPGAGEGGEEGEETDSEAEA